MGYYCSICNEYFVGVPYQWTDTENYCKDCLEDIDEKEDLLEG